MRVSLYNIFLKIIIVIFSFSLTLIIAQDSKNLSFFDGPHCFSKKDSTIIKYYNYGVPESFSIRSQDTIIFNGFLKDSLVLYQLPNKFEIEADNYQNIDKIFVVSDIHGQFEIFTNLLIKSGIINENYHWKWDNGHLVILGDVFDRGNAVHEVLWLIYNLENESKKAGGNVHFILGNHEIMVLQNDLRYVKEKYFTIADTLDIDLYQLYGENSFWGGWLRSKNFITKIDSHLFVHGGISSEIARKYNSIKDINNIMRSYIDTDREIIKQDTTLSGLFRSKGPIWYRGFFEPDSQPEISESELTEILDHFNVSDIIVGHTTIDSIKSFNNRRIINVDGGIKYGEKGEGLLILGDNFYSVDYRGKKRSFL